MKPILVVLVAGVVIDAGPGLAAPGAPAEPAAPKAIPIAEAADVFALARELNDRDAGRAWGMPVCGPILLGDPETNEVVANQADAEGKLRPIQGVWFGVLPKEVLLANT